MLWALTTSKVHIPAFPFLCKHPRSLSSFCSFTALAETKLFWKHLLRRVQASLEKWGDGERHSQCHSSLLLREMTAILHFLPPMYLSHKPAYPVLVLPFHKENGQTSARAGGGKVKGVRDQSGSEWDAEHSIDSAHLIKTHAPNENTVDGIACYKWTVTKNEDHPVHCPSPFPAPSQFNSLSQQKVNQVKTSPEKNPVFP